MKKLAFNFVILLVVLLVAFLIVIYLSLNTIVKKRVETMGPAITKVDVKLRQVSLSPFSGLGAMSDLVVGNPAGYKTESSFKVHEIRVALQPKSVFSDTIVIDEINIQSPEVTFEGNLTGNNLSKILENIQASSGTDTNAPPSGTKAEKRYRVGDFVINGGKINLSTSLLGGKSSTLALPDVHLKDIGKDSAGVTAKELSEQIAQEITKKVLVAVAGSINELSKQVTDTVKDLSKDPLKNVEKSTKNLKDIFKKK